MEMKATRDGFGEALVELGKENPRIIALSGDLEDSTRAEYFKKQFPERFFNLGISEQDMLGAACGLSQEGFIPFACSFAVFITNRAYDQLRISVCYNNCNVKIVGSHSGLTVGPDGATAQCLEDLSLTRVLPNLSVVCPADYNQARKATRAIAEINGPVYLRLSRAAFPVITSESDPFVIGRSQLMREGKDLTIIACGLMVSQGLKAAQILEQAGISSRVINMHTIKPLDEAAIIKAASETGAIVSCEEHQIHGGLGGAVAEVLSQNQPVPLEMVAVKDSFGESGEPEELLTKYHLQPKDIVAAAKRALTRVKIEKS